MERLRQATEREGGLRERVERAEGASELLRVELHAKLQTVAWMEDQVGGPGGADDELYHPCDRELGFIG